MKNGLPGVDRDRGRPGLGSRVTGQGPGKSGRNFSSQQKYPQAIRFFLLIRI